MDMRNSEIESREASIRHDEEGFRAIFEHSAMGIARLSADTTVEKANQSLAAILHYRVEDLLNQPFLAFCRPEEKEHDRRFFEELISGKHDYQTIEKRFPRKDGHAVWCRLTAGVMERDTGFPRIIIWMEDITERKEMELQLQRNAEALRESNRELEQFALVASHDLSAPLDKISAFSNLLQDVEEENLSEDGLAYLGYIRESTSRMQRLIASLLSLSLVTAKGHPFEPCDLNRIVEGVLDDLKHNDQERAQDVELGPLPTVFADATQMHQLFQNLIGNAFKFSREGVPPKVRIYSETVPCSGDDPNHLIHVIDNGVGFTKEQADIIFGAFKRLHPRHIYDGSGIGLAICKKIVERHEGCIRALGAPNQGAHFTVTLPDREIPESFNLSAQ